MLTMQRNALKLFLVCLLFSSLAVAQAKPDEKKPAAKSAAAASGAPDKALLQKIAEGWNAMDVDAMGKYYDQAPDKVFYDTSPLKYVGWANYAAGAKEFFATQQSIKFTLNDDAVVHRVGNLAYSTATVTMAMTDKAGKTSNVNCRWTLVFEKEGGKWLIDHEHFSAPMETPETPK
jgi:uncharacterized protein (TIGR02246 family)